MPKTVEIPATLLKKLNKAAQAFAVLEDELEDYLLSQDRELMAAMRRARSQHLSAQVRPLSELKSELCTD